MKLFQDRSSGGVFESLGGKRWRVCLIEAGRSLNHRNYSLDVLRKALPLFEGTKAFVYTRKGDRNLEQSDHLGNIAPELDEAKPEGLVPNIVGFYENVKIVGKRVLADLCILEGARWLDETLRSARKLGKRDLLGLSINGDADLAFAGDGSVDVENITKIFGVEVVADAAAGGRVIDLLESIRKENELMKKGRKRKGKVSEAIQAWLEAIKETDPELRAKVEAVAEEAGIAIEDFTPEQLKEHNEELWMKYIEWLEAQATEPTGEADEEEEEERKKKKEQEAKEAEEKATREAKEKADKEAADKAAEGQTTKEAIAELRKKGEATEKRLNESDVRTWNAFLSARIEKGGLPTKSAAILESRFKDTPGNPDHVDEAIREQKDALAEVAPAPDFSKVDNAAGSMSLRESKTELDRVRLAALGMLTGKDEGKVPRFSGPKALYLHFNGKWDPGMTGEINLPMGVRESVDTTLWSKVLVDAMHKRLGQIFIRKDRGEWRKIALVNNNVRDFRDVNVVTPGAYPNLQEVSEKQDPPSIGNQTDERVLYRVGKYSALDEISWEAMRNDDLRAIQRLPEIHADAAVQTFEEFFWVTLVEGNPNFDDDATPIYNAAHNNISTTGISEAGIRELIALIRAQTRLGSGKKQGVRPRFIVIPEDAILAIENTLFDIIGREPEDDTDKGLYIKSYNLSGITIPWFTDLNDHYAFTSVTDMPNLEVGFLDGKDVPEVVQLRGERPDGQFTNFSTKFQVTYIFGGDWINYRGTAKQVVA